MYQSLASKYIVLNPVILILSLLVLIGLCMTKSSPLSNSQCSISFSTKNVTSLTKSIETYIAQKFQNIIHNNHLTITTKNKDNRLWIYQGLNNFYSFWYFEAYQAFNDRYLYYLYEKERKFYTDTLARESTSQTSKKIPFSVRQTYIHSSQFLFVTDAKIVYFREQYPHQNNPNFKRVNETYSIANLTRFWLAGYIDNLDPSKSFNDAARKENIQKEDSYP